MLQESFLFTILLYKLSLKTFNHEIIPLVRTAGSGGD
jgi:hypothetical protein